jgi:predicted nuclease of predicted toxin-antitoxin system
MAQLGLIVTDASPLITLAAGEALDCLTMPGVPVVVPDMVYAEATENLAKLGAGEIVQWARRHRGQVEIAPTEVFAEYQALRAVNARTRSRGRGEQAALEVLNAAIAAEATLEAILLFEDSDVLRRRFVRGLPERVVALSTGDLLRELEAAGRIQSADRILDVAAGRNRNVEAQRAPQTDDEARRLLRGRLRSR